MKGFRFYLEYRTPADKRKRQDMGTVFAWCLDYAPNTGGTVEGASAVFDTPNAREKPSSDQ